MTSFENDPDLGKNISSKQLFCFGAEPLRGVEELAFAAGAEKFSALCGFRFVSAAPSQYPVFYVAFNTKLRSKKFSQNVKPPSWRVVKEISKRELHVLDKQSVLAQYGFDVDKFFQSDLFAQSVQKFQASVKRGLDQFIPEMLAAHKASLPEPDPDDFDFDDDPFEADVLRYERSIRD